MHTLTDGTTTFQFDQAVWVDEFGGWSPIAQKIDTLLTGATFVQESVRLGGRPITLETWMLRADLQAIVTWSATRPAITLSVTGQADRDVRFHQESGAAIVATPAVPVADPDAADWYTVTIKLIET